MGGISCSQNKSSPEVKHFEQVLSDFKLILKQWKRYEDLPEPGSTYSLLKGKWYDWDKLNDVLDDLEKIYASQKGCPSATIDRSKIRGRDGWESHKKRMVREFLNRLKTAFEHASAREKGMISGKIQFLEVIRRSDNRSMPLRSVVKHELIPLAADINPKQCSYLNGEPKRGQTFYTKGVFGEVSGGKGVSFRDFFRQEFAAIVRPARPIPAEIVRSNPPNESPRQRMKRQFNIGRLHGEEPNGLYEKLRDDPNFGGTVPDLSESCARRLAPLPTDPDPVSPGRDPLVFVVPVLVFFLLMFLWRRFRVRPAPNDAAAAGFPTKRRSSNHTLTSSKKSPP